MWDAKSEKRGLGDLPNSINTDSAALDISNDGMTIVGGGPTAQGEGEAFFWDLLNGMREIDDFPGGISGSQANGDWSDGTFIVGRGHSDSGVDAFLWGAEAVCGVQGLGICPMEILTAMPLMFRTKARSS